jgi:hypothetical protein
MSIIWAGRYIRKASCACTSISSAGLYLGTPIPQATGDYPSSARGFKLDTSHSSRLSAICVDEARAAVLAFFHAPPDEYTVIFTPNVSGALKLVGESYPFTNESRYILACDSHNSVHGIREFAARRDARMCYIPSTPTGGLDVITAHVCCFFQARSR